MRCESFESRLNEVLDVRQSPLAASDLQDHIRQCAPCRELARAYESVLAGLEQAEIPAEPAWLARGVLSQLRRQDDRRNRRASGLPGPRVLSVPRWRALTVAAAAVVLAAIGLPRMFPRGGNLAENNRPADSTAGERARQVAKTSWPAKTAPPAKTEKVLHDDGLHDGGLHDGGLHGQALATGGQHQRGDARAAARPPLAISFLDPSQLKADDLINSLPATGWAHDVADGLEPVTKPTVGAINGFLQLWGVGDEGRRS